MNLLPHLRIVDAAARNRRKSVPRRNTVNLYRSFLRFNYRICWRLSARKFSFQVSNWFAISFFLGRDPTERVLSLDESIFNEINRNISPQTRIVTGDLSPIVYQKNTSFSETNLPKIR